jgi:uncharacterized membrane protein YhaH (DUF805 family)
MKKLISWINITSIALIILGLIHLIAIIKIAPMYPNLSEGQFSVFIFMYMGTGLGTVLPGLISKLQIRALKDSSKSAWITLFVCSIYTMIIGIGAVTQMTNNPFAYLGLVIGISLFLPTLLIKKQL